jgi:perosamine synthetase
MSTADTIYPFFKGRVALHAILRAAGIGEGDQVLMPGYTCVVVPNAVNYTGAQPIYLDIDPRTYNLDCDLLEEGVGIKWDPDRAKAIIVQHTYGIPCDMDRITPFARKYGLLVIEDSCHALGSTWRGKPVGTLGDAAFFSSQWSKPVTTGLGGWAQINNADLKNGFLAVIPQYAKPSMCEAWLLEMQYLAFSALNHPSLFWIIQGIYRNLGKLGLAIGSSSSSELECKLPSDYQRCMHPLQERRLQSLLQNIQDMAEVRIRNSRIITECLREANLPTPELPIGCRTVLLRYPLQVANKKELLLEARKKQIPLGDWFLSPVHPNEGNWEHAGYIQGTCPVAEEVCQRVINISTSGNQKPGQIYKTVNFIRNNAVIRSFVDPLEGNHGH